MQVHVNVSIIGVNASSKTLSTNASRQPTDTALQPDRAPVPNLRQSPLSQQGRPTVDAEQIMEFSLPAFAE